MQKIISLFRRTFENGKGITRDVTPGAEWVVAGEGKATRKFDGTCCLVRDRKFYKRYEVKKGGTPPVDFEPAGPVDEVTGKQQGWVQVGNGPEDRWHREAFYANAEPIVCDGIGDVMGLPPDGTYELCGPKIQGNPERKGRHVLIPHGEQECPGCPRDFDGLRAFFGVNDVEGIVWHHTDGRMVKIKASDFGVKRGSKGVTR